MKKMNKLKNVNERKAEIGYNVSAENIAALRICAFCEHINDEDCMCDYHGFTPHLLGKCNDFSMNMSPSRSLVSYNR